MEPERPDEAEDDEAGKLRAGESLAGGVEHFSMQAQTGIFTHMMQEI